MAGDGDAKVADELPVLKGVTTDGDEKKPDTIGDMQKFDNDERDPKEEAINNGNQNQLGAGKLESQPKASTVYLDRMKEQSCYSGRLPMPYSVQPPGNGRFKGYSSTLNISGDYQKIFQQFFTFPDDGDAIIFLTRHEIFSQTGGKRPVPWRPTKNEQDSIEFRAFACSKVVQGRQDFHKALDLLNRAVKTAPVDELGKGESLKQAYLQRAAVLFKLRRLEEAFIDIERARKAGLDEESTPAVCAMKAKYYISKRLDKRAAYYMKLAKHAELHQETSELKDNSQLPKSETEVSTADGEEKQQEGSTSSGIAQTAENQQHKGSDDADVEASTPEGALERLLESKKPFKPFKMASRNPDILDASSSVALGNDPVKGRYLKASHQIMPGEVLIIEKPAVVHLNPQFWDQICFNCHLRTEQPIPCMECSLVGYCSEKCRKESWTSKGHSRECKMIGNLAEAALSPSAVMAAKVVLTFGVNLVMEAKMDIDKRSSNKSASASDSGPSRPSADKPDTLLPMVPLDSSKYKAHTLLEAQKEYWSKTDIFNHGLMVAYLLLLMEEMGLFDDYSTEEKPTRSKGAAKLNHTKEEAMKFVGKQMLYHAFTLKSNRFALSEMKLCFDDDDPGGVPDFQYNQIGSASLSTVNLLNHACFYCASWDYTKDGLIVVRAVTPIYEGEEITLCYTCNFATQPRSVRKAQLKYLYHFECKCRACLEDWQTGDVLMKHPSQFRCPKCRVKLTFSKCSQCGMDWQPTISETGKKMIEFYAAHPKIYGPQDLTQSVVDLFARYMSLTHFLCDPNCMNHIAAADALKKSFSRDGRVLILGMMSIAAKMAAGPAGDDSSAGVITQDLMPSFFS